ncbi:hypothetical protein QSV36_16400 [Pseudomonas sp. BCRC 81390]|uniref:hypothetical protein n=1 Tax=Pseudomonas sp. BCRC 81390 TaxID=3054778 RepID=UPI00259424C0|nr:hypothetical protein [Pseudomonas sp. BCRC 81390]MDM3887152.1 hypothetical protein [Pseudomonas sp. BCRC 81390]
MAYQHQALDLKSAKEKTTAQGVFNVKVSHAGGSKELVLTNVHFSPVLVFGSADGYFLSIGCSTGLEVGHHEVGPNEGDYFSQLVVPEGSNGFATEGEIYITEATNDLLSGSFTLTYDDGYAAEGNFTVRP